MLALLRQRNYALLLSGGFVSQIGTYMLVAALPYFVYATSRSVAATGVAVVSEMLPGVLFNLLGGLYADRLPRKLALALGNGSRGLIILPLLAVHGSSTIWIVYVVGFLSQSVGAFAGPFGKAALPHVVRREELTTANAALSAASSTAVLIGSPLGGLLLQQVGLWAVVVADAVSFAAPAVAILLIDVPLEDSRREPRLRERQVIRMARELAQGWEYARKNAAVVGVFLVTGTNLIGTGAFEVGFAPFVRHVLGGSAEFYSWALTLQGISGIAGALVMAAVSARAGPRSLVSSSLLVLGLMALVEVIVARQALTLALSLLVGFPAEFIGASQNALLQAGTEDEYRGRVSGAYGTLWSLTLLTGTLLTTLTADWAGIRTVLIAGSVVLMLAGFMAARVLPARMPQS